MSCSFPNTFCQMSALCTATSAVSAGAAFTKQRLGGARLGKSRMCVHCEAKGLYKVMWCRLTCTGLIGTDSSVVADASGQTQCGRGQTSVLATLRDSVSCRSPFPALCETPRQHPMYSSGKGAV